MSGSGRKQRVSKWDTKEEETQHLSGNDYIGKSNSYFRDEDSEHGRFYPESNGRNGGSRRSSAPDDDDEHLKSRQHSGEAWPPRSSRVSHDDGDAMMGYYDTRKSTEQDEIRQPYFRQSPSRDRPRTRRSGSRSNSRSRSRSRSPMQRVRRDAGGSYDRHKTRARVSPRSGREIDGSRYNRAGGDYDWEAKSRKTKYYSEDPREQHPVRVGGRSDYGSDFPEDSNNSRRRDAPKGEYNRVSNVPCRYFASGNCRNGTSCRFSHHGARGSPERKPEMFSNSNHSGATERMRNSQRWNDFERSDTGKSSDVEMSRVSGRVMSGAKGNNGSSWIDDMEMSPDWNYGVKPLKKPVNEEHSVIIPQSSQSQSQSQSQSRVLKDNLAPGYEHGSVAISQQDGSRRMFSNVGEKTVASSHHSFGNNLPAPPVQAFNQNNIESLSAVPPYQSIPLAVGGSQMLLPPAASNLPGAGLSSTNPENGNAQSNTVSREELNHISNISATLAQLFGNGQPIPQLHSTLNPKQVQVPEEYGKKEQSLHTQSDLLRVPAVTASQINNSDAQQVQIPDNLVSLGGNLKASCEENRDKKTEEEASKEPDGRKTREEEEEENAEDAENVVEEEEDDVAGDENNKKDKDPKGMRAFKFALVEIVKELLKPAWKEGGMNKDAYKNIVKKVVDKVTGAIQTGNVPQTQEKIDHYLSASKPKLTKLVQAYVSKVKKS
ncbi:unnamed protein product [Thlaspi arvense]|uniref:C3H1-type domain-containing protein n=1 Tax=Thlaspi arvense TaxID=13288 RepID=A0AAU9R8B3_THLAR|nr:unnamed protein product [Thlaspi arvense]